MKQIILLVLIITGSIFVSPVSAEYFKTFDGKVKTLQDYVGKGKWTIVMMWAHDCHVCNKEAHQYVAFHDKHKNKDAIVLGISMDGFEAQDKAEKFIKQHKLNFENIIGKPQVIANMYEELTGADWFGTPTFLFFAPNGELKAQQVGAVPTPLIEQFMAKQVSANGS